MASGKRRIFGMNNMPRIIAIIQARVSSTRLAGKILLKLGEKTVLEHVALRVKACKLVDDVIIATTILAADDAIIAECSKIGIKAFRGSSDNVLQRYYLAAKEAKADIVIRVTSDCPFIDTNLLHSMLEKFKHENCDYLSNTIKRTYPRGFDLEIFTFSALQKAYTQAKSPHELEHVTPYIYMNTDKFNISNYSDIADNSDLRVTLDTIEDWQVIERVYIALSQHIPITPQELVFDTSAFSPSEEIKTLKYQHITADLISSDDKKSLVKNQLLRHDRYNSNFMYKDVVAYLRQNPDIIKINANVEQKK